MVSWDRNWNCTYLNAIPNIGLWFPAVRYQWHVDQGGIRALVELAAMGRVGYMHANAIIGKLIKKVCDNIRVLNPSAFVMQGVKNAMKELEEE